mmetsp:Transcript_8599/g.11273  ORF Transcript_8599/g.11273 Transcript_8599/m.11273 type:complete len:253 (+) Transcript_8599:94-852(+)
MLSSVLLLTHAFAQPQKRVYHALILVISIHHLWSHMHLLPIKVMILLLIWQKLAHSLTQTNHFAAMMIALKSWLSIMKLLMLCSMVIPQFALPTSKQCGVSMPAISTRWIGSLLLVTPLKRCQMALTFSRRSFSVCKKTMHVIFLHLAKRYLLLLNPVSKVQLLSLTSSVLMVRTRVGPSSLSTLMMSPIHLICMLGHVITLSKTMTLMAPMAMVLSSGTMLQTLLVLIVMLHAKLPLSMVISVSLMVSITR